MTGLGVISALGSGKDAFWKALVSGKNGFSEVKSFSTAGYRTSVGAEVSDFSPRSAASYVLAASQEALSDAGLRADALAPSRCGAALGTTTGELLRVEAELLRHINGGSPLPATLRAAFRFSPGCLASDLGRSLGFRGPHRVLTTACSAGNAALSFSFDKVEEGRADLMLAGGVDLFSDLSLAGFNRLLAVAPEVCAPFSKDRKGLIPGEGCAILVLEPLDAARERGARVYAEFLGYGLSSDGLHPTVPDAGGIGRAMAACLRDCGLSPADVDYISAHGTGTALNDRVETQAIHAVFGPAAPRIPVSSIKSMLGHAMGAASALEAAAACLSLETGVIPPTMNHVPGDPDCDLDYVPNASRRTEPEVVLSNAFAFGGSNAVIAFSKPGRARPGTPETRTRVAVTGMGLCEEADPLAIVETLLPDKDLRYIDRPMAFALCAAKRALDDAGLDPAALGDSGGVVLDCTGELDSFLPFYKDLVQGGPSAVEPRLFPNVLNSAAATRVAIAFGLRAVNWTLAGSFPGGECALACAFDFLRRPAGPGLVLAGGVLAGPAVPGARARGRGPGRQGAFIMAVERLDEAVARGARILAEVEGYEEALDPGTKKRRMPSVDGLRTSLSRLKGASEHVGQGWWGGTIRLRMSKP